jgi:hypothetical protein
VTTGRGRAILDRVILPLGLVLLVDTAIPSEPGSACFDFSHKIVEPLRPPIPLVEGRDNSRFGTYPNGVDWASTRTVLDMPIGSAYAKMRDHENQKDMKKTKLSTRVLEQPGYLQFDLVDVVVSVRALFIKMKVAWTEAWGYALADGTDSDPRKIVISYQKVAGTSHIQRQCGSYVLEARGETTDISMYEEVKADRRSAEDTRDMHAGILENLRAAPAP